MNDYSDQVEVAIAINYDLAEGPFWDEVSGKLIFVDGYKGAVHRFDYETGEIADDFNANSLGDMYSPKVGTQEALYMGRTHFLDCIKTRQQPHTNIYKAKQIMEWLL